MAHSIRAAKSKAVFSLPLQIDAYFMSILVPELGRDIVDIVGEYLGTTLYVFVAVGFAKELAYIGQSHNHTAMVRPMLPTQVLQHFAIKCSLIVDI